MQQPYHDNLHWRRDSAYERFSRRKAQCTIQTEQLRPHMKKTIALLLTCVALQLAAFAQDAIQFTIGLSAFPGGLSGSAELSGNSFSAQTSYWSFAPDYGRIFEMAEDGSTIPVLQFANVLTEVYPPMPEFPGSESTLYYFSETWNVTPPQAESLLARRWFMEVSLGSRTLISQIVPVPEPTYAALLILGAAVAKVHYRRTLQRSKAHR